jgi:FkbM family methyltransferase
MNRNWLRTAAGVIHRHYYPRANWGVIDAQHVKIVETEYGKFYYDDVLRDFRELFIQVDEYDISEIRANDVVVDLGANIGAFTILIAPKVAHVVAVEPLFYKQLCANIKLNKFENVSCLQEYIGEEGKIVTCSFYGRSDKFVGTSFHNIIQQIYQKHGLTPTVLKTDCEGGEWLIQPEDLENIRVIEAEVHNFNGRKPMIFKDMLISLGYTCYYTINDGQMMLHARKR